jgi:hypothetical protein
MPLVEKQITIFRYTVAHISYFPQSYRAHNQLHHNTIRRHNMRGLRHKHRAQRTRQSPSNDSQRKDRPSRTPGPQHTEPQRQRRQAPPIRGGLVLVASNNLKYEVDVDEEYNMPAPADMERLGITSKAGSPAGPPAPPLQQYPPELDKTELAAALKKVPCIRSIEELLPALSDRKRRRVDVEEFFRIIDQPNPTTCRQTSSCA